MSDHPRIPLAGVIGSPVAHSRSPRLHAHWLHEYDIAGHYVPLDVLPEHFDDVVRTLPAMGFVGANVTIPHKEKALKIADNVTDRAAIMGAANTLTFREDGKIHADNTDGHGFMQNLRQHVPDWSANDGPAVIIGAGGAARAVLASLIDAGATEIRITNRTRSRANALRQEFGTKVEVFDWNRAGDALEGAVTVVNASSLGMTGKPDLKLSLKSLVPDAVVTDLVYTPLETALLSGAREIGCRTVDGLGMLLHQAAPGFERWFGVRPEVDDAARAAVLDT